MWHARFEGADNMVLAIVTVFLLPALWAAVLLVIAFAADGGSFTAWRLLMRLERRVTSIATQSSHRAHEAA